MHGTAGGAEGADAETLQAIMTHGLTEAEVLAIKTYTADDYKYINPATANDAKWMASRNPGKDEKTLRQEGGLHAAVMAAGMDKLEAKSGTVYRGERMTAERFGMVELAKDAGRPYEFKTVTSLSVDRSKADQFSQGGSGVPANETIAVIWEIDVATARDISILSVEGKGEGEWTLPPGTKCAVTAIETRTSKWTGRPKATAFYTVKATQITGK
jgi:hypothetical protein